MTKMGTSKIVKRTACDRCRSKRVRCPRTQDGTVPCSRCIRAGEQCITGSPGNPGRPRKARHEYNSRQGDSLVNPADACSAEPSRHTYLYSAITPISNDSNLWHDSEESHLFDPPLSSDFIPRGIPTPVEDVACLPKQQVVTSTPNLLFANTSASDILDSNDFLLGVYGNLYTSTPLPCQSVATVLLQFQEKMEEHKLAIPNLFSNPRNLVQDCRADANTNMDDSNPVAFLVNSTQELVRIVQALTAQSLSVAPNSFSSNRQISSNADDCLRVETVLLIIACYISLMKLYEALFHGVYHCFSKVPPGVIKAIKVKGVLRIGGILSLQDVSVHSYATGIVDVLQKQIEELECCMGLPTAYRLSDKATSRKPNEGGFLSRPSRQQLFETVMQQEDVKFCRENKSCLESIQHNMKNSIALF